MASISCSSSSLGEVVNSPSSVLSFQHLSFSVKTKSGSKYLIEDVSVNIRAGELLALMGPSGAGKSTLLDVMAFRKTMMEGGSIYLNGQPLGPKAMHKISTFVEQEDALLGVLTVRESVTYALRLHLPLLPRKQVNERVNRVLGALGLNSCADQRIGTPISRGISGGQKRRVTAACAMVTFPRVLFLDEVTSGLDSTSAREVMASISTLSKAEGMIVIASIHQPSLETLAQFTNVMFLASGKTCYLGRVDELDSFFEKFGHPVGRFSSPSDHAMNFLNSDFAGSSKSVDQFREFYLSLPSSSIPDPEKVASGSGQPIEDDSKLHGKAGPLETLFWNTAVLSERTALNYLRNLLAYGVRVGMYGGMGLMLATIWIRLGDSDSVVNDRLSVHFYSVAFLGFMSVAGIPSFLEERAVYYRESKNGLYSTLPFLLSNTLVNIPFLFASTVIFTVICYWAIGLHPGAAPFFRFVIYLFLAIFAAESQALVVASLIPIFVAALAISSFVNGFWMSVGGYFIKARSLPRFWFFSFHYMDYQKYAFELMTNSDLRGLTFTCDTIVDGVCACSYPSSTPSTCTVSGQDILNYLDIGHITDRKWIGILVSIVILYRIALFLALKTKSG
ncbi:ABC transporter G family member 11 [Psilocybe cubensis]|uniref:ABC transporter domain-containing protein n=2 Tax=Psilocybe cubensis TaxID=181762 RepID=A0A8H8CHV7_PSICU|nr:ABC transporter G family member 11 [Psilocybe cubensis]KAH9475695.1 ABC transporter G family member 11 [Psilocybe cubensis]